MHCYAITDRSLLAPAPGGRQGALAAQVAGWFAAGVAWVQMREKDLPEEELAGLAARLARVPRGRTRFLVNGTAQLALRCGADGVHLRSGSARDEIWAAAEALGSVSVSCHTPAEVETARAGGASVILWAPVFGKVLGGREVRPGTGLAALGAACELARPVPVFALGGVTVENAPLCVEAGAAGVAGIRLFHGEGWRALANEATSGRS